MPDFVVFCDGCERRRSIPVSSVTLICGGKPEVWSYLFVCVDCQAPNQKICCERTLPLLLQNGVRPSSRPAELDEEPVGPPIDEDDLIRFGQYVLPLLGTMPVETVLSWL